MVFCPPIIQPFQFNAAIWSLTSHVGFVSGGVFFARKADRGREGLAPRILIVVPLGFSYQGDSYEQSLHSVEFLGQILNRQPFGDGNRYSNWISAFYDM